MAKYTTLVRNIVEQKAGLEESTGYNSVNDTIAKAIPKIFNFDFPIFDEGYRNVLCTKIIKHYYMREIGAETVGLWQLWLDTRLNEIMPYYNQLYKSELLDFNPLYDTDLTRQHTNKNDRTEKKETTRDRTTTDTHTGKTTMETSGEGSGTVENTENTTNKFSDTPQGSLQNVVSGEYLTNATVNDRTANSTDSNTYSNNGTTDITDNRNGTDDETVNENGTINTTEDYLETVQGKQGGKSYAALVKEYRDNFLNIDMMVINELSDLFMLIY